MEAIGTAMGNVEALGRGDGAGGIERGVCISHSFRHCVLSPPSLASFSPLSGEWVVLVSLSTHWCGSGST